MPQFPTPDLSHLSSEDYHHVYEPAEDSFLMLDALESDYDFLSSLQPLLCLEVGCGSGVVSAFLGRMLGSKPFYMCTDINPMAAKTAYLTGKTNGVSLNPVVTDLVSGMLPRLQNKVDILVFNPPYVVTEPEEVGSKGIEASWAGGLDGREVTDRFLPSVPLLLSEKGVFYLVVIKENKPEDIADTMAGYGFVMDIVMQRRTGPEHLSILKFVRNSECKLQS